MPGLSVKRVAGYLPQNAEDNVKLQTCFGSVCLTNSMMLQGGWSAGLVGKSIPPTESYCNRVTHNTWTHFAEEHGNGPKVWPVDAATAPRGTDFFGILFPHKKQLPVNPPELKTFVMFESRPRHPWDC